MSYSIKLDYLKIQLLNHKEIYFIKQRQLLNTFPENVSKIKNKSCGYINYA